MDTVYTEVLATSEAFDLYSDTRAAIQNGIGGTKEEATKPLYTIYTLTPKFNYVEMATNVSFAEALQWVASGVMPRE